MTKSGISAFLDVLAAHGVSRIFGNPGTTELPLNDALIGDDRFTYVLGLHETPLLAMADGYAMAKGDVAVVNLHACCGLGNAMGLIYNAYREGTPLLVTAGQQDRRLIHEEAILGGDMVSVARPFTKWADEARSPDELPALTRRAIQRALTPPRGPVFLSLPLDVQTEPCRERDLAAPTFVDSRLRPPVEAVRRCAAALAQSKRPAILAGSRVTEGGAVDALVALAEAIGAPVFAEPGNTHGRLPFPSAHPLYARQLPLWSPEIHACFDGHDAILCVGLDVMRQYVWFEPQRPLPVSAKLLHIDCNPTELGKNYPTEVAVWGDLRIALEETTAATRGLQNEPDRIEVKARRAQVEARLMAQRAKIRAAIDAMPDGPPMPPGKLMATIARALPPRTAVVEEAVTTTGGVLQALGAISSPEGYFAHRGWTLGWGSGCAIGVKMAWPDRPVLSMLGDGAAVYGLQSLWTAAKHKLPVTFVVANNRQYQVLMTGSQGLNLPQAVQGKFLGLDLSSPAIDYPSLARGYGVDAIRLERADEIEAAVRESLLGDRPRLIEVPIARELAPMTS